jgi:hypothetical protein
MIIEISQKVGKHCSQRFSENNQVGGESIRLFIEENWDKEDTITISFEGVLTATSSFIDEAIGKLAFNYSPKALNAKLKFINTNDLFMQRITKNIKLRQEQSTVSEV